ncbi:hypothetical protein BDW68DRAFT_153015 [Aspergillus falconensis]
MWVHNHLPRSQKSRTCVALVISALLATVLCSTTRIIKPSASRAQPQDLRLDLVNVHTRNTLTKTKTNLQPPLPHGTYRRSPFLCATIRSIASMYFHLPWSPNPSQKAHLLSAAHDLASMRFSFRQIRI